MFYNGAGSNDVVFSFFQGQTMNGSAEYKVHPKGSLEVLADAAGYIITGGVLFDKV